METMKCKSLPNINWSEIAKARDYVNFLQDKFEETPHIFKAEDDDNDLSTSRILQLNQNSAIKYMTAQ